MKLSIGRLINGLQNCCCGLKNFKNFFNFTAASTATTTERNDTKKLSFKESIRLVYYTFFYNVESDSLLVLETILNPFMLIMNRFVRIFGKLFVLLVWILCLNMVYIVYTVILPEIYEQKGALVFLFNFFMGTLMAVNTFFHYTMGWLTNPGVVPNTIFENVASVCKKCVAPKPARTHHCSVCQKCVLKMDHHCPWFDNCIGFYNHRYFFMFCTFIAADCLYLVLYGFHYYAARVFPGKEYTVLSVIMEPWTQEEISTHYKVTTIEFFVLATVIFAVGGLASFNAFIISNGLTNIEIKSINLPFCKKSSQEQNIYDLGFLNNWKIFLGFKDFKTFLTKVVLPSNHKPVGDGVDWYEYMKYPDSLSSNTFIV